MYVLNGLDLIKTLTGKLILKNIKLLVVDGSECQRSSCIGKAACATRMNLLNTYCKQMIVGVTNLIET